MTGQPNPVPGLYIAPGQETDSTTQTNMQRILLWSKQVSPVMYGTGAAMLGTLPVPSAPSNAYLMQAGQVGVAFTSGLGTLTFPHPFPNGVLSAQTTGEAGSATAIVVTPKFSAVTLATLPLYFTVGGSAFTGTGILTFLVIGF